MKIAFLTHNSYDMLTDREDGIVGGAQLQQILIGRELAARGHEVVFVENDAPHKRERTVDGIEIVCKSRPTEGRLPIRAGRWVSNTLGALRRVDPDICYCRVLGVDLIPTALYCTVTDTGFIYGFAHDSEVSDDPVIFDTALTESRPFQRAIRWSLEQTDALIAQNEHQAKGSRRRFSVPVHRIPNAYERPDVDPKPSLAESDQPVVLWVARVTEWKRPGLVLDLAAAIPEARFVLVGPPVDDEPDLLREVETRTQSLDNADYVGFVPYGDIDAYFAAADIFLNTSREEGFPNTFLQAWATGTPVASLAVDPDEIVADHDLGCVAGGSMSRLEDCLRGLVTDWDNRTGASEAAFAYFQANYTVDLIVDRYEDLFTEIGNQ